MQILKMLITSLHFTMPQEMVRKKLCSFWLSHQMESMIMISSTSHLYFMLAEKVDWRWLSISYKKAPMSKIKIR